jgi:hypothetical protein
VLFLNRPAETTGRRTVTFMIDDPELVAAVGERAHWQLDVRGAVYAPPGATAVVRVRPVRQPMRRERYVASIMRSGNAVHAVPFGTAVGAVQWAERTRLS